MKVKDIEKLREKLHNDKREAFSQHQVWLMLSEYNTEVPTVDAVPMSVLEEIKAGIRHFMFEVNPSSSESDYACNYIMNLIDKKMGKDEEELDFPPHKKIPVNLTITKISEHEMKGGAENDD